MQELQDWQRFVDVSNTKNCVADCLSRASNVRELNLVQLCLNSMATESIIKSMLHAYTRHTHTQHNTASDNAHGKRWQLCWNSHVTANVINSDNRKLIKLTFILCFSFPLLIVLNNRAIKPKEWQAN